jgi:hypothetical protein
MSPLRRIAFKALRAGGGSFYVLALQYAFLSLSGNPEGIPAIRLQILVQGLVRRGYK